MAVINAERLTRAERVLQVAYNQPTIDRQLESMQVDKEAFDMLLKRRVANVRANYPREWKAMDPRLEPALNTLFMHFFLVGLVAGRTAVKEIE